MFSSFHSKFEILATWCLSVSSGWFCWCPNDCLVCHIICPGSPRYPARREGRPPGQRLVTGVIIKPFLMDSFISSSIALAFCPLITGEREDIGQWILVFLFFCWIDSIVINILYISGIKARNSSVFGNQYVHFNIRVPTYASSPAADLHFYFIQQKD